MQAILPALRALLFASATLALAALCGCGLKGDLVLPEPANQSSSQGDAEEEATESEAEGIDQAPA